PPRPPPFPYTTLFRSRTNRLCQPAFHRAEISLLAVKAVKRHIGECISTFTEVGIILARQRSEQLRRYIKLAGLLILIDLNAVAPDRKSTRLNSSHVSI